MRIFITGGTGFIGRHLVSLMLKRGHELFVLTRNPDIARMPPEISLLTGDLSDFENIRVLLRHLRPEGLLHLAWEGLPDYSAATSARNLMQGVNLYIEAAAAGCSRVVTAGSCWEYASPQGIVREDAPLELNMSFPAAKNALRIMGESIAGEHSQRFHWARIFFAYGPGQRTNAIIPYIMNSMIKGEIPEIKTPEAINDFIWVEDAACAMADLMEHAPEGYGAWNIGSGQGIAVRSLASEIGKLYDVEIPISPFSNFRGFWADTTRISKALDWRPSCSLSEGIRRFQRDIQEREL